MLKICKNAIHNLKFAVLFLSLPLAAQEKIVYVEVENPSVEPRTNVPVVVKLNDLKLNFNIKSATVFDGATEISSQLDDLDDDRKKDELAFVVDVAARQTKKIKVTFSAQKSEKKYKSEVYAEMLLSDKKGNHPYITSLTVPGNSNVYNDLHHHGPAFESELVAYRIYFDKKQTVDIYGKFNKGFELKESQFYPTDEQLARGFGDDVLRVSGSCGVGTLKGWNGKKAVHIEPVESRTETICASAPIRTVVDVDVRGWQYKNKIIDMKTRYILYAGHRDCEVQVTFAEPLGDEVFCCGVQNIKGSQSFYDDAGLVACWGNDWPVNDTVKYAKETVGIAACLPQNVVTMRAADKVNYLYLVKAAGKTEFTYHITFTSMKETFGYKTPEAWFAYLKKWKQELLTPCRIAIKK